MTGSNGGDPAVAGGLARHVPVLVHQVIDYLAPREGSVIVDATFGAGGYTRAILATPGARVFGIDRDPSAIENGAMLAAESGGRLTLAQARFSEMDAVAARSGITTVDGVVFDLGVSSMQLDSAARGFSFRLEGPLDMRMGAEGANAADVVALATEQELAAIIATLGEERHARAVARAIVAARAEQPLHTTAQLAQVVTRVVRSRPGDIHPATRTFQALRIFVNEELGELAAGLASAERLLKPGGRLVVVSFHSLEDRIVKTFLADRSKVTGPSRHQPDIVPAAMSFRLLTRRPVTPDEAEIAANPRARSAKLRAAERTDARTFTGAPEKALPRLPALETIARRR